MILDIDSIEIPLVLSFLLVSLHVFRRSRASFALALISLTGTLVWWGAITWMFRDGMGPESVETAGFQAIAAFLSLFWLPILIWLTLTLFCWLLWKYKQRANM